MGKFTVYNTNTSNGNKLTSNKSSPIKSLVNLFKLVAIVAFINYELIYQQQVVAGRSRGLIYNKDGKFIYRPSKSSQGHIIVIDDRHRDSYRDEYSSQPVAAAPAPVVAAAETAYQPVRLISQRAYHPAAAQLAPPIRSYYTGEQGLLINLGNLQGVAQPILTGPGGHTAAAADPIPLTLARPRSAQTLRGSLPASLTSLPLLQLYRPIIAAPSRSANELTYSSYQPSPLGHHHSHLQQQQQSPLFNHQTNQIDYGETQPLHPTHQQQIDHHHQYGALRDSSIQHSGYAQPSQSQAQQPAGGTRIYDADTPIGAYELPLGYDQQSPGNPFFDDSPPPPSYAGGAHMGPPMARHPDLARHHHQHDPMKQLGSGHSMQDFDELINAHNHDPLVATDHSGSTNQVPAPKMRNYKSQADRGQNQALLLPLKRYKSSPEPASVSSLGGPIGPRGLKKNSDSLKTKHIEKDAQRDSIESQGLSDPNGSDGGSENHRYWRQFKDQFDIVQN